MRHMKAGRALGVKPAHRQAMMRNLVTSLVEKEQIRTTVARAKEMRREVDKMITLGKRGDLHARRQALRFMKSTAAMEQLFGPLAERYAERPGGYTRIIKLGLRRGDGAQMAMVTLVDSEKDPFAGEKQGAKKGKKKAAPKKKKESALKEVAEEVKAQPKAEAAAEEAAPVEEPKVEAEAAEAEAPAEGDAKAEKGE